MRLVGAVRPLHLQKARTREGDSSPGSRSRGAVPHAAMAPAGGWEVAGGASGKVSAPLGAAPPPPVLTGHVSSFPPY